MHRESQTGRDSCGLRRYSRCHLALTENIGEDSPRYRSGLPALRAAGPLCRLLARQAEAFAADEHYEDVYGRACAALPDDLINFQHDPLACAVALGWDGVTIEDTRVITRMHDGWLREEMGAAGQPMRVVTAVEAARFSELWLSMVTA